jgi:hypothetical protein
MAASKAERITLLPPSGECGGLATSTSATTGLAEVEEAIWGEGGSGSSVGGASGSAGKSSRSEWGLARVAGIAVTATLALASVIVLMNTSRWGLAHGVVTRTAGAGGVALEVEPVGHVIWLGSKLPNVKRVFLHRNQELLHEAGWKLKLWCVPSPAPPPAPAPSA